VKCFLLLLCVAGLMWSGIAEGKTKIVFWHFFGEGNEGEGGAMKWFVDEFNRSQDEFEVEAVAKPWGDGLYEPLFVQVAAGMPPDVTLMHDWKLLEFASKSALHEISKVELDRIGLTSSDFFPGPWELGKADGRVYAIPIDVHPECVYYNHDLLAQSGVAEPVETFSEADIRAIGRKLNIDQNADGVLDLRGLATPAKSCDACMMAYWAGTLKQFGGSILDANGMPAFHSSAGLDALEIWVDLVADGSIQDDWWGEFEAGRAALTIGATGSIVRYSQLVNLGVAPFFRFGPELGVKGGAHMLSIPYNPNRSAATHEGAVQFIKFVSDKRSAWPVMWVCANRSPRAERCANCRCICASPTRSTTSCPIRAI
jgi:multiple sugar transport system substrate-binding protein